MKKINITTWWIVVVLAILIIIIGHNYAVGNCSSFFQKNPKTYKAKIEKIIEEGEVKNEFSGGTTKSDYNIKFKCIVLDKEKKGQVIIADQKILANHLGADLEKHVEKNDLVFVNQFNSATDEWVFAGYYRLNKIMLLGLIFVLLTIIVGRWKGMNGLISLIFTSLFVFAVFIPWILGGHNIYIGVMMTCVYTIVISLLLIEGFTMKSFAVIVSCCVGTSIAAIIPILMDNKLHLTGIIDEDLINLLYLHLNGKINLVEILYSGIIIGSLGAIMDISMDIASSLYEVRNHAPDITFKKLYKSGLMISRDVIGTMSNTLILAYMGGSILNVLLLISYASSLSQFLNIELVITELLKALVGAIALIFTAPTTVFISSYLYSKK